MVSLWLPRGTPKKGTLKTTHTRQRGDRHKVPAKLPNRFSKFDPNAWLAYSNQRFLTLIVLFEFVWLEMDVGSTGLVGCYAPVTSKAYLFFHKLTHTPHPTPHTPTPPHPTPPHHPHTTPTPPPHHPHTTPTPAQPGAAYRHVLSPFLLFCQGKALSLRPQN